MHGTGWLVLRVLRQRWSALVPLVLVVAFGGSGALVAAGAAERTSGAYASYLERAAVADVVINPSLNTAQIDRVVRDLPGVRRVTSSLLFFASVGESAAMPRGDLEQRNNAQGQVSGSIDGRFTAADRPVVAEGRFPTADGEVLVNHEMAEANGLAVGDELPLTFWRSHDDQAAAPDEVISPVAVERTTVVGIATLPDEVLPDGLFPRERVVVSPPLARRYDCLPDAPAPTATPTAAVTLEEAIAQLYPDGCSTSYRYYALDLDGGDEGVAALLDTARQRIAEANATLPAVMTESSDSPVYYMVATTTAAERERVERSTRPIVTALGVLAVAAAVVTAAVFALGAARELRSNAGDQAHWRRLGLTGRQHAVVVAVPLPVALVVGVVGAAALAWVLSPVGPVGSVRSVEPSPARELTARVVLLALVLASGCALVAAALAARAAARLGPARQARHARQAWQGRWVGGAGSAGPAGTWGGGGGWDDRDGWDDWVGGGGRRPPRRSRRRRRPWDSARPDVDQGIRAAYRGARGRLAVASCALAAGTLLAAVVFGASLSALLTTPAAYGWPWDLAVMTGFGYGDLDREAAAQVLDDHPDVVSWTELGFTNEASLDGEPLATVVAPDPRSGADFAVVEGRLPQGDSEIALGARTAAERGLEPGDTATVSAGSVQDRRMTITGIAVLPPLGQFQADRTGPGTGMVLPLKFDPDAAALLTFAGIDVAPDADPAAVFAELHDEFVTWDLLQTPPVEHRTPVRPAEIVNVQSMRAMPLLVGGLLTATAVVGLTVAVAVSVRARRQEVAVLRALGFTPGQVRTSVRVQAAATMLAGLVVGVPPGIAAGRIAWRAFATQLGVADHPAFPGWWIVVVLAGVLLATLAAAAVPARLAARITPATALRTE